MKPRLLDLFCGAGGAAWGYNLAGFEVVGVDINPQPHYPFTFIRADALEVLNDYERMPGWWDTFDAVHASPPCKRFTSLASTSSIEHPDLLTPTRERLRAIGLPYVIENVRGAPFENPTLLCGMMFDLAVYRHRLFETSFPVPLPLHPPHGARVDGERLFTVVGYGGGMQKSGSRKIPKGTTGQWQRALGILWTSNRDSLAQAIPPAFTEYIGEALMAHLAERAA